MKKAVFLDRDGVLNQEIGDYVYTLEDFKIVKGIIETLQRLKESGYLLIVITNQGGISKGRFSRSDMKRLHDFFQEQSDHVIDYFYYAPHHIDVTHSLLRKPNSLMWEKALAKFSIDPKKSWMVGDKERDLVPAKKLGMQTIRIFIEGFYEKNEQTIGDYSVNHSSKIGDIILKQNIKT